MTDADERFERSVARWLRAYPRRWRTARAAEVTAVLADLAPTGARRLDLRSGVGLVRAGWATRWREHPPLLAWLGYVLLDRRLDPRYRDWARDDIEGPLHAVRRTLLPGPAIILVVYAVLQDGPHPAFVAAWLAVAVAMSVASAPVHRRRAVSRHLVVQAGEVVTPSGRLLAAVARTRTAARPWLTAASVVVAGVLVCCVAAVALTPRAVATAPCGVACVEVTTTPVAPAYRWAVLGVGALGALAGLLLARVAGRRLRRWTPIPQPHRWVAPTRTVGWMRVALLLVVVALVTVAASPLAVVVAGPVGVVACAVLPVLLAARRVVDAGGTRAVAGVEVLRAVLRLDDPPDRVVEGHVPAAAWLPVGTVLPRRDPPPA